MSDWIYVDNSNVFIEGQRVSAVRLGMALTIQDAFKSRALDFNYRISFGKLYKFVAGDDQTKRREPCFSVQGRRAMTLFGILQSRLVSK